MKGHCKLGVGEGWGGCGFQKPVGGPGRKRGWNLEEKDTGREVTPNCSVKTGLKSLLSRFTNTKKYFCKFKREMPNEL